jgi:pyruvate/2-oxoglutarate dehydrogenase complex dihydrolipoamide acyltransferase (E2) component
MGVTTPCAGEIAKIDATVKGTYAVGTVLGYVEASEADAARFQKQAPEPPQDEVATEVLVATRSRQNRSGCKKEAGRTSKSTETGPAVATGSHFQVDQSGVLPVPASAKGASFLSPRVVPAWPSFS